MRCARGRDPRNRRRGGLGLRARHRYAQGVRQRRWPGADVQQHQGLQRGRRSLQQAVHGRPLQLQPRRHDVRPAQGRADHRPGEVRTPSLFEPSGPGDGQDRAGQGEHRHRQGHQPVRFPGAEVAPARRRPLHLHDARHRDQGPRHRAAERRHLPRHDRQEELAPRPAVAAPALGPGHGQVQGDGHGHARRLRFRLGALPAVRRLLAGATRRVGVRGDGRDPRCAGRARRLRDGALAGAGQRRDRDRGLDLGRSQDLRDGRTVRRVHRLLRRRPVAQAHGAGDGDHAPQRSDLPRHARRHDARRC